MSTRPAGPLPFRRRALRTAVLTVGTAVGLLVATAPAGAGAVPDAWTSPSGGGGNALDDAGEATITTANAGKVAQAWTAAGSNTGAGAPTVAGGVVYYAHQFGSPTDPPALVAASPRTGATLWRTPLGRPDALFVDDGVTVTGHLALIPFQTAATASAGLTAVDTTTHKVVWTTTVGANSAQDFAWSGHQVYADSTRAYVHLADNTLGAYRLSDGKLQWTVRLANNQNVGLALGAGVLYVGYSPVTGSDTPGITAYDTATGRQLWTGPGRGTPVVAGGRVFSADYSTLVALNAGGCGSATCPAVWSKKFPATAPRYLTIGGADGSTLFVSYQKAVPANAQGDTWAGVLSRVSAATGATQWTFTAGGYVGPAVRGGSTVWVLNEYRTAAGALADRILGFNAAGAATSPLRSLPAPQLGYPQTLAIGGGTLFDQTNTRPGLLGYRVPGS